MPAIDPAISTRTLIHTCCWFVFRFCLWQNVEDEDDLVRKGGVVSSLENSMQHVLKRCDCPILHIVPSIDHQISKTASILLSCERLSIEEALAAAIVALWCVLWRCWTVLFFVQHNTTGVEETQKSRFSSLLKGLFLLPSSPPPSSSFSYDQHPQLPTTTTEEVNKMADRVYMFCKWIASWLQQTNNLIWWCKKHNCSYKFHWEQQHHRWLHCWFLAAFSLSSLLLLFLLLLPDAQERDVSLFLSTCC